ncbi:hypothetical protein [Limosilactobacillus reuteri]|uniref:hypothetical protein n=2 Tax=Limosilactobacillus reuteri TaxID=1598 RepID=UPI002B05C268|nr:hypothetical protein [Limosilactobacillus reuteri]
MALDYQRMVLGGHMKYLALGLIGSSPWIFLAVASYKADKISVPAILILIFCMISIMSAIACME